MKQIYLILLLLLSACATPLQPREEFQEARQEFVLRLVWKDYPSAAFFVNEELREDFLSKFDQRSELRIIEMRPEKAEFQGENNSRVMTWSSLDYYRLPSTRIKTFRLRQDWELTPQGWKIITPFPDLP
jgi:hypothetical protein